MNPGSALANVLWLASGVGHVKLFGDALSNPAAAQQDWLRAQLVRHAASDFGQRHDFAAIHDVASYVRQIPLTEYGAIERDIRRIANGEADVLARGPVTHLAPTSGSTGGRKLIPFSPSLTNAFNAAVFQWLFDLVRQRPGIMAGPAYWSISPLAEPEPRPDGIHPSGVPAQPAGVPAQPAGVPIGFADDADYLGGSRAWLVREVMAVPSSVRAVSDTRAFWRLTLLALLRQRGLRLISIWHPSFLDLLTNAAEEVWPELVGAVGSGMNPWEDALSPASRPAWLANPDPGRSAELKRIGAREWPRWWPQLQVVSCWGEQAAEPGWRALVRRLPQVVVQAKGLLATECVVTIPWQDDKPLAVMSHFFEFLDEGGEPRLAHQLVPGRSYEVVVTNGGGLWRYRLGDVVECTGHVEATPSLRFVGRARVSDLRGEKLSEAFVAGVLAALWPANRRPSYAALKACDRDGHAGYELLVSPDGFSSGSELGPRLDMALAANPHYALARRLGQLSPVTVVIVSADASVEELRAVRGRIGDAKPQVLLG